MLNLVNAVDNTNQEFLYRGVDAVDVFCKKINEIRDETRGAREPKSKPLVEKTKCVRFESCGGWSKFLVPATDIHSQKQL